MFKHILITLDGSPRAESVLAPAIDIARAMSAKVTLLRIVEAPSAGRGERGSVGRDPSASVARTLFAGQAHAYSNESRRTCVGAACRWRYS
jgi:nucleotide-binding universal stress UspA family protein